MVLSHSVTFPGDVEPLSHQSSPLKMVYLTLSTKRHTVVQNSTPCIYPVPIREHMFLPPKQKKNFWKYSNLNENKQEKYCENC